MKSFSFSLILEYEIQSSPIEKKIAYQVLQETHETKSSAKRRF